MTEQQTGQQTGQPTSLPLDAITVMDLSRALAGPYCTALLGDLTASADVLMETFRHEVLATIGLEPEAPPAPGEESQVVLDGLELDEDQSTGLVATGIVSETAVGTLGMERV
jgi:hypothetical protein